MLLGLRPEHVRLGEGRLRGRVRMLEPLGAFTVVKLSVEGQELQALAEPRFALSGEIPVRLDEEQFHFFDPQTEERL